MTKVIFSFDTEDYINPIGADGILRSAKLLSKNGIKGCWCMVGEMASALKAWNRSDVINELNDNHCIEFHSLSHSKHPCINEYSDLCDFNTAKSIHIAREKYGIELLKSVFDKADPVAVVPPGSSHSYVAYYGYADMGIKLYSASRIFDQVKSRVLFCDNLPHLRYDRCLDTLLMRLDDEGIKETVERVKTKENYVFYHHPAMSYVKVFCDELNFMAKNREPQVLSPLWEKEKTEKFFENFEKLVLALKADPEIEFTTYSEFVDSLDKSQRTITKDTLKEIYPQLLEKTFPVTTPDSLCISDLYYACIELLKGNTSHQCGKVYGFLKEPFALPSTVSVRADDIKESAKYLPAEGFIPEFIYVGDQKIGPFDFLMAAMELLISDKDTILISPRQWQIDLDQFPALRDTQLGKEWIHDPAQFNDDFLSQRLRLQSWTFRFEKNTPRFVL
ncbi:MAG: hypothetical protein E7646_04975 [Ruminococcaceae bacterium]|nr:hypothetical protein [Oscillospiraceae bacterium]